MTRSGAKDVVGVLQRLRRFAVRDATANLALCLLLAFMLADAMNTALRAVFAFVTGLHVWLVVKLLRQAAAATDQEEAAQLGMAKRGTAALWACDTVLYLVIGVALLRS